MSDLSARLALPYILPAQAQKHVTHNEALQRLDALVHASALTRAQTEPPAAPALGDSYILPASSSGDWAGHADALAVYETGGWLICPPQTGWRVYLADEAQSVVWDGTAWQIDRAPLQNLDSVGIGTEADATNRLALASEASLFTHAGAGHQLKLNKASAPDTASLLFQTGWAGRAEIGTAGSDALSIKTTPDGNAWTTALSFDPATGLASGAAVQQSATDITQGRIARADYAYGPGNTLGPVALSGGIPQGALIERGENANGTYARFADGTQICQTEVMLSYVNAAICSALWTFPAAFAPGSAPQVLGTISATTLLSTAPSLNSNKITPLVLGSLSVLAVSLQVRALTGFSFASGEYVTLRTVAIGQWA